MKQQQTTARAAAPITLAQSAELLGLCSFAFAQPLLDQLVRYPQLLVAQHAGAVDIVALLGAIVLLPFGAVLLLFSALRLVGLGQRPLAALFAAALVAIAILPMLHTNLGLNASLSIGTALLLSMGVAWLRFHAPWLRQTLRFSALAALVFAIVFLLSPSLRPLLRSQPNASALSPEAAATGEIPVILVVFDALPLSSIMNESGAIENDLFPSFTRLSEESIWFRNATASCDFTDRALPAILTGRAPAQGKLATVGDHPENLFTLLAGSHDVFAQEPVTHLCPDDFNLLNDEQAGFSFGTAMRDFGFVYLHRFLPRELATALPTIGEHWRDFGADAAGAKSEAGRSKLAQMEQFLDTLDAPASTSLHFLHSVLPHRPNMFYPSGQRYSRDGVEPGGRVSLKPGVRVNDAWAALHSYQRHLLQTQYVDRLLGQIMDRSKASGLYDRALMIVLADHGESFDPDRYMRRLTRENAHDILPVPLFVKLPQSQRAGEVSDRNVEAIDILPTLLDVLGVTASPDLDGSSALRDGGERPLKSALAHRDASAIQFPREIAAALWSSAARKTQHFGMGQDALYAVDDSLALVGTRVDDYEQSDATHLALSILEPDTRDTVVGGEIRGHAVGETRDLAQTQLALAVDGVIRATTRPYRALEDGQFSVWSALLPERFAVDDRSRLDVFEVNQREGRVVLAQDASSARPSFVGLRLGLWRIAGVVERGFQEAGRFQNRWAESTAELMIPLQSHETVQTLRVSLNAVHTSGTHLRISVNDLTVFEDELPAGDFDRDISLPALGSPATLLLRMESRPARDEASDVTKALRVRGIWLLP